MTQAELARLVGCSEENITAIENERNRQPGPELVAGLSRALDLPVEDIYGAIAGTGNIAHLAHIGGLITGLLMIRRGWYRKPVLDLEGRRRRRDMNRLKQDRDRVNEILDKVSREGIGSLSRSEREFLERMRKGR